MKAAQDMHWKTTTVSIEKSTVDIAQELKKLGAKNVGSMYYDDEVKLVILFEWLDRKYLMEFRPLKPDYSKGRKSRDALDKQAIMQMGRLALNYIKCSLQLAMNDQNAGLMASFEMLPGGTTIQQSAPNGVMAFLQDAQDGRLALPEPDVIEAEVIEP